MPAQQRTLQGSARELQEAESEREQLDDKREQTGAERREQLDGGSGRARVERGREGAEAGSERDAPAVEQLDPETRARRDAALAKVRKFGDPVLRARALPIERFDDVLEAEIGRMSALMQDALGVGLAATQVGVLHRVLVYRAYPEDEVTALVNPELEWVDEELASGEEGCLSLPGVHVEVQRPARIKVCARDAAGGEVRIEADGLPARIIQHEIDHLDGVLILDRISREARKEAMRAMREAQEPVAQPAADVA